jgi:hypothetical protein
LLPTCSSTIHRPNAEIGFVNVVLLVVTRRFFPDSTSIPEFSTPRKSADFSSNGVTPFVLAPSPSSDTRHIHSQDSDTSFISGPQMSNYPSNGHGVSLVDPGPVGSGALQRQPSDASDANPPTITYSAYAVELADPESGLQRRDSDASFVSGQRVSEYMPHGLETVDLGPRSGSGGLYRHNSDASLSNYTYSAHQSLGSDGLHRQPSGASYLSGVYDEYAAPPYEREPPTPTMTMTDGGSLDRHATTASFTSIYQSYTTKNSDEVPPVPPMPPGGNWI